MDNNYSLSDLAVATGNGNGFGGNWGGALGGGLVGYILGASTGGNGLFGNNRGNAATTEDLASGFNFSALQNKGNDILAAVQGTNQNLSNAVCQLGYQSLDHAATIGSKIDNCCCTTQRAVDSVKFDMANYASGLQIAQMQGTQRVLDKLCEMEGARKDEIIAQQGQRIAALEADARMCGVVRWPTSVTYATTCNPLGFGGCNPCANI